MSTDRFLSHLELDVDRTRRQLVSFIHDKVTRAGLKHAVQGLSGGIDSALVAYLTAEALGPENVLALRMPYQTSSQDSLDHAMVVIEALGIQHDTIDITPMLEPLFQRFPDMDRVRQGNAMARQRMIILYDQSAAFEALVIGTGNKTEALLGYTTHYGDNAAAMHPLGNLYKCQVRQLARAVGVPDTIIDKAPSAGLWEGQTDEGELGFTYDEADQLLYLLLDRRYSLQEAVEAGFPHELVGKVWNTICRTRYKRQLPLVPNLSRHTLRHHAPVPHA